MVDQTDKSVTKMNETKVKICSKCGQTKPIKDFQRRITIAQARAYLKRQNITRPQTITSKLCKTCRPKPKPISKLTLKELHNKRETGDINRTLADILIKQKKETTRQIRVANTKARWQNQRNKPIKAFAQHLQNQVDKYAQRYHAYKSHLKRKEQTMRVNPITPTTPLEYQTPEQRAWEKQHALLAQHRANYEQARQIKEREVMRARETGDVNMSLRIVEMLRLMKEGG